MKSPYVKDLQPNQIVHGTFLVAFKDIRQKKTGEPYLSLILADRSGDIDAKMWDNVDRIMATFERNDFVRVKGMPQVFQNRLQFTIHNLTPVSDAGLDLADYFPSSTRDLDQMLAELRGVIASIGNPHLRALLEAIFDDEYTAQRFQQAPAAKTIHHAWLGGLIEHVLSLCTLCRMVGPHYADVDVDLLLAGAILHDIGKIEELSWDRGFQYTDEGQLIGHIVMGLRMIDEKARTLPDFPPKLKTLLDHMILSHHGELEFGSPKVPVFAEALLLHHLDNLDSKMETVRTAVAKDRQIEGAWSGMVHSIDRHVLKKERYLNPQPSAPRPAPEPAPVREQAPPTAAPPALTPVAAPVLPAVSPAVSMDPPPASKPEPMRRPERGPSDSTFAERLKQALGD